MQLWISFAALSSLALLVDTLRLDLSTAFGQRVLDVLMQQPEIRELDPVPSTTPSPSRIRENARVNEFVRDIFSAGHVDVVVKPSTTPQAPPTTLDVTTTTPAPPAVTTTRTRGERTDVGEDPGEPLEQEAVEGVEGAEAADAAEPGEAAAPQVAAENPLGVGRK